MQWALKGLQVHHLGLDQRLTGRMQQFCLASVIHLPAFGSLGELPHPLIASVSSRCPDIGFELLKVADVTRYERQLKQASTFSLH